MSLEKWHTFFQYFGLISLALAFIGGVGNYFTGKKLDEINKIDKHEKSQTIELLENRIREEQNKLRSFEVETHIKFKPNWDSGDFGNSYALLMKSNSYFQLVDENLNVVVLEQIQLPQFYKVGSNIWEFNTRHVINSTAPLNEEINNLRRFKIMRFHIPFISIKWNEEQSITVLEIKANIKINGKVLNPIVESKDTIIPVAKHFSDQSQGHASIEFKILNPNGILK